MSWKDTVATIRGSAEEETKTYSEIITEDKKAYFTILENVFAAALTNNNAQPILDSIAQFGKTHSAANCAAIIGQSPGATIVKRYEEWQQEQHPVKSGGNGIVVLSQIPESNPPQFTPYRVFDVKDTGYKPRAAKEMNCDVLNTTLINLLSDVGIKTALVSAEEAADVNKQRGLIYLSESATNEEALVALITAYSNHFVIQKNLPTQVKEYAAYIFAKRTNIALPAADVFYTRINAEDVTEFKKDIFNARKIANEMTTNVRDRYLIQAQNTRKTAYRG